MSDEDDTALAELLKPRVESELRQAYDREPTLLDELEDAIRRALEADEPETRRTDADQAQYSELEDPTKRALEADEEFMSEVEKVKRQLGEGP